jgi:hypothetical protein
LDADLLRRRLICCVIDHDVPLPSLPPTAQRDYVQVDALDEQRAAIPPSTVISYWKPEVAVRLVTDFSVYPMDQVGGWAGGRPPGGRHRVLTAW